MELKIIRTENQYKDYLREVSELVALAPAPSTPEADKLDLLTVLLEAYENQKYPIEAPDAIDAILFRMQEQGLKQSDLVSYFGTRSRVSEVLGRKRPLTVQMIRALAVGLGISADTLVGASTSSVRPQTATTVDWAKFPIKEMVTRGWIRKMTNEAAASSETLLREFLAEVGFEFSSASFRRTLNGDAYSPNTKFALYAWLARIVQKTRELKSTLGPFETRILSMAFMKELAQLSWFDHGPQLAVEFLAKHGIALIVEPHLKGTLLDGAALKDEDGTPIIGITLRHDRIDNFWFTLLHEIAHLWKHVGNAETFMDDLDGSSDDRREAEANRIAREALIPRIVWKRSDAFLTPSKDSIERLSRELKIHPAIIAGRLRRELENYQLFADMVGQGEVSSILMSSSTAKAMS